MLVQFLFIDGTSGFFLDRSFMACFFSENVLRYAPHSPHSSDGKV